MRDLKILRILLSNCISLVLYLKTLYIFSLLSNLNHQLEIQPAKDNDYTKFQIPMLHLIVCSVFL